MKFLDNDEVNRIQKMFENLCSVSVARDNNVVRNRARWHGRVMKIGISRLGRLLKIKKNPVSWVGTSSLKVDKV